MSAPRIALIFAAFALLPACRHESANADATYGAPPPAYPSGSGYAPASAPAAEPAPSGEPGLAARYAGAPALDVQAGKATYYGDSLAGHKTASGERYDPQAFTAAHRKLPFGTVVRVIRMPSGPAVYVRITDRGPFGNAERIIDLSRAAATRLDMIRAGVVSVRVEVVAWPPR